MEKITILIPAYEPDKKLLQLIDGLQEKVDWDILLVDDGSGRDYQNIFESAEFKGCKVLHHKENLGKGAALKTGIQQLLKKGDTGLVTADSDGQHLVDDIIKVGREVVNHPETLVLGERNFSQGKIPVKSWIGNRCSTLLFYMDTGVWLKDTQTGLRGLSGKLLEKACRIQGERYEYEMNMLRVMAEENDKIEMVPIATVYEDNNKGSHFRPIQDGAKIYQAQARYLCASVFSFLVDILMFALFAYGFFPTITGGVFLATVVARLLSGTVNFTLNKNWSFAVKGNVTRQALAYTGLFLGQMILSASLCSLVELLIPEYLIAGKIVVDSILFFISYVVQKRVIFRQNQEMSVPAVKRRSAAQ